LAERPDREDIDVSTPSDCPDPKALFSSLKKSLWTKIIIDVTFVRMQKRTLEPIIRKVMRGYPLLAIVGPRQSGKTTLARKLFPEYTYLSLENVDVRVYAQQDPRGFLADHGQYLILDEVQRVPDLFSYLQEQVDRHPQTCRYILTGSQQFLLMANISQSLAGRISYFRLFPFTLQELLGARLDRTLEGIFHPALGANNTEAPQDLSALLWSGLFPRIHHEHLEPHRWLANYTQTYLERDVRNAIQIGDLRLFEIFLKLCASHSGQLLNYASLANAVGVSQPTIKRWISVLEASGIVFFLPPFLHNFNKRLVKAPKLYFTDTGLLCYLLSIRNAEQLKSHPLYGAVFETFVASELYKRCAHVGEAPPLYFWRDKMGNEVDMIADLGSQTVALEFKSAQTLSPHFADGLRKWFALPGNTARRGLVVYAGPHVMGRGRDIRMLPWWRL
jgi:hypothetical protein